MSQSPGLRVTAIVAAHNEADIIGQTVDDLLKQDIHVHVLDHRSTDGTREVLQPLERTGRLTVETFPEDVGTAETTRFALSAILARKEQIAREGDADWFINHDADEFRESPWLNRNLRAGIELVDRCGYNAIDFAVLNFWPTHDGFRPTTDIREVFLHYEVGAPWDRVQIRCWKKAADVDLVSSGGHDTQFAGRRVFPLRFILRHYPIRGQAHGVKKVFVERRPRFAADERARGWHVQYDALNDDHSFIRDPATLRLYDPEQVRVDLQIHHREVEALTDQQRDLSGRLAQRDTAIDAMRADLEAERERSSAQRRLSTQLQTALDAERTLSAQRHAELGAERTLSARLHAEVSAGRSRSEELRAELDSNRARIDDLTRRLDELYASRSWKVTAPLRALYRLVATR